MKLKKSVALMAPLLAIGLGSANNALADAYAVSTTAITGGFIDVWQLQTSNGNACSLVNSQIGGVANCTVGDTTFGNAAADPRNTSGANYTINGTGTVAAVGPQTGLVDVLPQQDGTAQGNNQFTPVGVQAFNYSRGDSELQSEQAVSNGLGNTPPTFFQIDDFIEAEAIAESNVVASNQATAAGNVSSGTLTTISIELANPGQIAFSFQADPFLQAILSAETGTGSVARAIASASVTLNRENSSLSLFQWAPDGQAGGIIGGTEVEDDFSLNLVTETQVAGTTNTYNPIVGVGSFTAYTDELDAGRYTLTLAFDNRTEVTSVPTPASLALLGLGLTGLGLSRRFRKANGQAA